MEFQNRYENQFYRKSSENMSHIDNHIVEAIEESRFIINHEPEHWSKTVSQRSEYNTQVALHDENQVQKNLKLSPCL